MSIWMIRAGKHGEREDFALENNYAVLGWDEVPDLTSLNSREAIGEMLRKTYPNMSAGKMASHTGQLYRFVHRVQIGDVVALPLKRQRQVAFGTVEGEYEYHKGHPPGGHHVRKVNWRVKDYPRDRLDRGFLNSLGSMLTICTVGDEQDEANLRRIMGGQEPVHRQEAGGSADEVADVIGPEEVDVEEQAQQQIVDFLARKFSGHKMAEIVDAILTAQGYKTEVSPPGPDGGVDIIAGRGPLGFDPPRMVVQVKAGNTPQDVRVIRELKGVMQEFGADQGLFVSWGDFKRSVYGESRRNFFNIRLWNASDVLKGIQAHYDQFPDDLKAELPLKRVWTLVPEVP